MRRLSQLLALSLVVSSASCVRGHDRFDVEMRASEDLKCPRDELVVDSPGGDIFTAKGCGREATYVCYRSQTKRFECNQEEPVAVE